MLLPKQILALRRIVAKAVGRYACTGVRVERTEQGPRAMATDGRRAVVFKWEEPQAGQFPPVEGMNPAPARGFTANVPARTLAEAGRGLPRRPGRRGVRPALSHLLLDESDPSTVRMAAGNGEKVTRALAQADGGVFPDCDAVLPAPARDGTLYDPARHGKAPFTHTRIGVNARQFAETLKVVADLAADDEHHTVVMTVPVEPNRPIRLDARCPSRRAAAAIMPVQAQFADYDEPRRVQRPAAPPLPLPASGPKPTRGGTPRPPRGRARANPQVQGPPPDQQHPTG